MTMNLYLRSMPIKYQAFDPDAYKLYTGIWLSNPSFLHVFEDNVQLLRERIKDHKAIVLHVPNQSRIQLSDAVRQLGKDLGRALRFHGDPLSVAYVTDLDSLFKLLLEGVPVANSRLVLLCKFNLSDNSEIDASQIRNIKEHAEQREITIMEPR